MARKAIKSLSVEALLKLRDDIGAVLASKVEAVKEQLRLLGSDYTEVGRIAVRGRKRGGKVAAKYRHPKTGETWAGRGAMARWLKVELKAGKKLDDFLVDKKAAAVALRKKSAVKRGRKKK